MVKTCKNQGSQEQIPPTRRELLLPGFAQVIGKGGSIIKTIRQESGARVEAEETEPNSRFQGSGVPTFCFCSGFWVWQKNDALLPEIET